MDNLKNNVQEMEYLYLVDKIICKMSHENPGSRLICTASHIKYNSNVSFE